MAETALELEVEFVTTPSLEVDLVGSYNVPPAPSSFASLTDVQLTDPQNGQIPKYNSETEKWENADETTPVLWTDVTGTLIAGQTSITLQDSAITTDATIDIYTDTYGVKPTNVVTVNGQITITFSIQLADLGVKVRIS